MELKRYFQADSKCIYNLSHIMRLLGMLCVVLLTIISVKVTLYFTGNGNHGLLHLDTDKVDTMELNARE